MKRSFEIALRAGIPIIGVHTDDLVNVEDVLLSYSEKTVLFPVTADKTPIIYDSRLYWSLSSDVVTVDLYNSLKAKGTSLVVINPEYGNPLIHDAGDLPVPEAMMKGLLAEVLEDSQIPSIYAAVKGLSLKTVDHVLRVTVARDGQYSVAGVRKSRSEIVGQVHGIAQIDAEYDFYHAPLKLKEWLTLNKPYFLASKVDQLRPRGVLLYGPPGTGKSMGAKYIAKTLDVPLYRMDIVSALDKYIGVSEKQVQRMLEVVESEAPAVLLIDEVEKLFNASDDGSGTVTRIMSQLLWWLAEHKARVLTVMTTNDLPKLPAELYREGRIDFKIGLSLLNPMQAKWFAGEVLESLLGSATAKHMEQISIAIKLSGMNGFSHAEIRTMVYEVVKKNKWIF